MTDTQAFNPVAILLISFAFKIQEPNMRLIAIVCVCSPLLQAKLQLEPT